MIYLLAYLAILVAINQLAFGAWEPLPAARGLWFYTGAAALVLGSLLVSPFFTTPADALSYATAVFVAVRSFPPDAGSPLGLLPYWLVLALRTNA